MKHGIWLAALLLALPIASACSDDDDTGGVGGSGGGGGRGGSGGAGGSGGTGGAGGSGGNGGNGGAEARVIPATVCTDYSGALDRVVFTGDDTDRCLELVLASGTGTGTWDVAVPDGWMVASAGLHAAPCDEETTELPVTPTAVEGDITFTEATDGSIETITADVVFTFPDGAGGEERLRIDLDEVAPAPGCAQ